MFHRKIGKLLLGKATPFQILAACLLGGWIGFVPGVVQAPGSVLLLLALLAILNANLWLAALTTLIAKGLSIALLPLSHAVGTFLLEGPTEGLFRSLVNAPYLAWCGFEYHAVTGGWVVGGVFGIALGMLLIRATQLLRKMFLGLDEGSEKFRELSAKGWVKFVSWLLLGAAPKRKTFEKLAGKKIGMPIRPLGALLVVGVGVLLWVVPGLLAEPLLTGALRGGLERANGATVDLAGAEIDLADGRFTLNGLAMADRTALEKDSLRAASVTADLDVRALLSRRWKIEELVVEQAASGVRRETPGKVIGKREPEPTPPEPPEPTEEGTTIVTLEDLLEDAKKWRAKLERARDVLGWVIGDEEEGTEEAEREVNEDLPLKWTRATQLLEKAPTVLLDRLRVARLEAMQVGDRLLVIDGWNLSTEPALVEATAGLSIASADGEFRIAVNPVEGTNAAPTPERLEIARLGISGDELGKQVRYRGEPLFAGGSIDIVGAGRWWREKGLRLDVPVEITLRGCEIRIPGSSRMEKIEKLTIPIQVSGRITSPRFRFQQDDLLQGLIDAGRNELADRARKELTGKIDAEADRLEEKLKEKLDDEIGDKIGDEAKKAVDKFGGGLLDKLKPGGGN